MDISVLNLLYFNENQFNRLQKQQQQQQQN